MAKANFKFNPFDLAGVKPPANSALRRQILEDVADFVRDSVLDFVGGGKSPVAKGTWQRKLTEEYRDIKGSSKANLGLTGDLLDSIISNPEGNSIITGVFDSNVGKAEGNNIGSYGKRFGNRGNARRFIPLKGESWNRTIESGIRDLVLSQIEEEEEDER